jgi:hypothetical protein
MNVGMQHFKSIPKHATDGHLGVEGSAADQPKLGTEVHGGLPVLLFTR